jgi:hypothetical protein
MKVEAEERRGQAEVEQTGKHGNHAHEGDAHAGSATHRAQAVPNKSNSENDPQNATDR